MDVAVELEVLRNGLHEKYLNGHGDPKDTSWTQEQLHNWLRSEGWHQSHWHKFKMRARERGRWKVLSEVGA